MKIQITATISINGYLSPSYEKAHRWSFSRKYSLSTLRGGAERQLHKYTSLLSLITEKQNGSNRTYLAEATAETFDLIKGLLLYRLADEVILYVLPEAKDEGIRFTDCISAADWQLCKEHRFRDGTCYRFYCRNI